MSTCPACGAPRDASHIFCASCGSSLTITEVNPAPQQTAVLPPPTVVADRTGQVPVEVLIGCALMVLAAGLLLWPAIEDLVDAIRTIASPFKSLERFGFGLLQSLTHLTHAQENKVGRHFAHAAKTHLDEHGFSDAQQAHMRMIGAFGVAYAAGLIAIAAGALALIPRVRRADHVARWLAMGVMAAIALGTLIGSGDFYTSLLHYAYYGHHDFEGPGDVRLLLAGLAAIAVLALFSLFPNSRQYFDTFGERTAVPSIDAARWLTAGWAALTVGEGLAFVGLVHVTARYTVLGAVLLAVGGIGLILTARLNRGAPYDRLMLSILAVAEFVVLIVGAEREMTLLMTWFLLLAALALLWAEPDARRYVAAAAAQHPMPAWVGKIAQTPSAAYSAASRPPANPPLTQPGGMPPPVPAPTGQRFCHRPNCGLQGAATTSAFCPACGDPTS